MSSDRSNRTPHDGVAARTPRENSALKEDELLTLLGTTTQEYVSAADLGKRLWPNDPDEKTRRQSFDSLLHRVNRKLAKAQSPHEIRNAYNKGYRLVARDQSTPSTTVIPFRPSISPSADTESLAAFWQRYTPHGPNALLHRHSHLIADARWTLEQYERNGQRLREILRANIHCTYLTPASAHRDTELLIHALTEPFLLPLIGAATVDAQDDWQRFRQQVHIILTGPRRQPEDFLYLNATTYPAAQLYHLNHKEGWVRLIKEGPDAFDHATCAQEDLPSHGYVIDVQSHLAHPDDLLRAVRDTVTQRFPAVLHTRLDELFAPARLPARRSPASERSRREQLASNA